jgi:hypothetical protein
MPEPFVSFDEEAPFKNYGAWIDYGLRLNPAGRSRFNNQALALLDKPSDSLTETEWNIIRSYSGWGGIQAEGERGVLYDFYTSPPLARMTWRLLHKTSPIRHNAKILEPSCGTGVFFQTAPEGVELHGVELDTRTAAVAAKLHPRVNISNTSFEAFNLANIGRDGQFDYIIGNVPFGDRTLQTAFLDMHEEKSLDKYFIVRSIDNLVPGGTLALIAHPGVLANKTNEDWRYSVARKAQFLGAVKLNNQSFFHTQTAAQPDILFFKKHPADIEQRFSELPLEEFKTTPFAEWARAGSDYFTAHPGHIMGVVSKGTGQWGSDEVTGTVQAEDIEGMIKAFTSETPYDAEYREAREQFPLPEKQETKEFLSLDKDELDAFQDKRLLPGMIKTVESEAYLLSERGVWSLAVKNDRQLTLRLDLVKTIGNQMKSIRSMMRDGKDVTLYQRVAKESLKFYKSQFGSHPPEDKQLLRFLKTTPPCPASLKAASPPKRIFSTSPTSTTRTGSSSTGITRRSRPSGLCRNKCGNPPKKASFPFSPITATSLSARCTGTPTFSLPSTMLSSSGKILSPGTPGKKLTLLTPRSGP